MPSEFPKAPELVHPQKRPTFFSRLKENFKNRKENERKAALASGDSYIWAYVLAPFIILVIGMTTTLLENAGSLSGIVAATLFMDRRMLKLRGVTPPHWGWIFLGFPYIWKRCNILKKSKLPAWISAITFSLVLGVAFIPDSFFEPQFDGFIAAETTSLLAEPSTPAAYLNATCLRFSEPVEVTPEIKSATCTLDNGKKITVFIRALPDSAYSLEWATYTPPLDQLSLFNE